MSVIFNKLIHGYKRFRQQYAAGDQSIMRFLADQGQKPSLMVVACCDSRVDPALILQCDPGDLFVVRNLASIVPPYENDAKHHGTSAALEFGIRLLEVKDLILFGHSQCGGVKALKNSSARNSDFIQSWISLVEESNVKCDTLDQCVKHVLDQSYKNCLTFPWIAQKIAAQELEIHRWFFEIKSGKIYSYCADTNSYNDLI